MHGSSRIFGLAVLALASCTREPSKLDNAPPATAPTAPAPAAPGMAAHPSAPAAEGETAVAGTVVETMDAAGYTYAKLDRGGSQVWVAGPQTKLAVGDKLSGLSGQLMTNFHSSSMNRTFDQIYFVNSLTSGGATAPADPHAGGMAPAGDVAGPTEPIAPVAGGMSIADVFAKKATLAGKPVVVKGKAVKVNNGIMDRNWIHLQDGTGAAGTNDLLVTTSATVNRGDVIVVRGTIALDKDFGAGYKYALLVENATVDVK